MKTLQELETSAFLHMAEAVKAMEQQLADAQRALIAANERIAILEAQVYGGSTK